MNIPVPSPAASATRQAWEQIEQAVARFADLAQTEISANSFAGAWLEQLLQVIPGQGGAVTLLSARQANSQLLASTNHTPRVASALAAVGDNAPVESISPRVVRWEDTDGIVVTVAGADQSLIQEIALAPGLAPAEIDGAVKLVKVFAEIAADYQQRWELRQWRERNVAQRYFEQFVLRMHASLDPRATAFAIANDGRTWLQCDRLSVVRLRGRKATALAISGVDTIDSGAYEVRCLRDLASTVAITNEALWWRGGADEQLLPQLAEALHAYLDCTHAQCVGVIPLRPPGDEQSAHGVLIAEWLRDAAGVDFEKLENVARHSETALGRAFDHDLPLIPLLARLAAARQWLRERARWAVAATLLAAAVISALVFIKVDFLVEAEGTLQPRQRQHLFAPADGVVEQVLAEHGQQVKQGDVLLQLRDAQLEYELSRATGDLQTTQSRLETVRAKRSSRAPADAERASERDLAAEEEQLKQKLLGLRSQLEVLQAMRNDLQLASPLDGEVLTWHVRDLLQSRPVKRGQQLLTIARLEGPWILELKLPDDDAGHLLQAQRDYGDDLPVTFLLTTDPAKTHTGTVEQVALRTDSTDANAPSTLVQVRLGESKLPESRAGAGVIAKVHCGRRAVGYVWLRDLIDAVRTRVLF